jgi:osmotically-inducible protein OsmY
MAVQNTSSAAAKVVHNIVLPAKLHDDQRRRLARIKRAIRSQTGGGVHQLKVEASGEMLLLRGRCASFYCKQKAQHAAMDFLAGEMLINEIQVDAVPR